jgi:hypothetical protein
MAPKKQAIVKALSQIQELLDQIDMQLIDDAIDEALAYDPGPEARIDFATIVAGLKCTGLPSSIIRTGDDVATIYIGPWLRNDAGDQKPSWMITPGQFEADSRIEAYGWSDSLALLDGVSATFRVNIDYENDTSESFADTCAEFIMENHQWMLKMAQRDGFYEYNGIG